MKIGRKINFQSWTFRDSFFFKCQPLLHSALLAVLAQKTLLFCFPPLYCAIHIKIGALPLEKSVSGIFGLKNSFFWPKSVEIKLFGRILWLVFLTPSVTISFKIPDCNFLDNEQSTFLIASMNSADVSWGFFNAAEWCAHWAWDILTKKWISKGADLNIGKR